ncbi:hypothetical protein K474DRAFT_1659490 [Panus rudis PR-1116 ss-1]|nr:hypothetical protein K474DRAFT_1659490 [Panus rudis PR-1116 ss-1]
MHFSKTYSQLLLSLPPDLRQNAIEYRQLKKLINKVVQELTALGLSPDILQHVLQQAAIQSPSIKGKEREDSYFAESAGSSSNSLPAPLPRITYELNTDSNEIQPRLRLWTTAENLPILLSQTEGAEAAPTLEGSVGGHVPTPASDGGAGPSSETLDTTDSLRSELREVVIPLKSDSAFFQSLLEAHQTLGDQLSTLSNEFRKNIDVLARDISFSARPMSAQTSFQPYSHDSNPVAITVRTPGVLTSTLSKSDLYAWREIFQLYIDAEVFESHNEESRGERAVSDAEERLTKFMQQLSERGFTDGNRLQLKRSRQAMQMFLEMNASILNLLKFQYATTEAVRKILKKHAKRTALPTKPILPSPFLLGGGEQTSSALVSRSSNTSLAMMLVQAIGQTLLPIVPHIDDYACAICTNIAFKPIRLQCGHLFCVRCLVKMQKRGQDNCPMCRAPTVLIANRSNVDWALLNFMKDWFPVESRKKLKENEREVAQEEMQELGLDTSCIVA